MSDFNPGEKKGGALSWQAPSSENPAKEEEKPAPEPESREKVVEQAKRFLEEDEVKDASTDKKIAFLESKGLRSEEIQELLGVSRNEEASTSSQVSPSNPLFTALTNNLPDSHTFPNLTTSSPANIHPPTTLPTPNSNLPRIPHHPRAPHTPIHQAPPPHNSLRFRLPNRHPLRHAHQPRNAHGGFPHRIPTLARLNRVPKPAETNCET
jgi:hypothetical protein